MADDSNLSNYTFPIEALLVPGAAGRHWLHLASAEQLARAMWECEHFDLRHIYQMGGVSDGIGSEPEGFVVLRNGQGRMLMMATYIAGDVQWPTSPAGDSAIALRSEYEREISCLRERSSELLPVSGNERRPGL